MVTGGCGILKTARGLRWAVPTLHPMANPDTSGLLLREGGKEVALKLFIGGAPWYKRAPCVVVWL